MRKCINTSLKDREIQHAVCVKYKTVKQNIQNALVQFYPKIREIRRNQKCLECVYIMKLMTEKNDLDPE